MQEKLYSPLLHERIRMKNRVIIVGGGAAGMLRRFLQLKKAVRSHSLKKMKNLAKSCILQEKGAAM